MPLRTIKDALFTFRTSDGRRVDARRGETVDVPEGKDLTRGDKFGAFTAKVDEEPPPPKNTELLTPQLDWSAREWDSYVNVAHISEVEQQLNDRAELDRAPLALAIIEAENRKKNPRAKLIEYLNGVAGINADGTPSGPDTEGLTGAPAATPAPSNPTPGPEDQGAAGTVATEDLTEVSGQPVDKVLAYAKEHPESAAALLELEQAKGEAARKSLVEGLSKITAPTV